MTALPIRIVVADAHPVFALGVRALLDGDATMEIVGEATDGEEALRLVEQHRPDVLLLDLALAGLNGLEVLNRIAARNVPTRIVVVTAAIDRVELRTAVIRGAHGVLLKNMASEMLGKCVRQVMKGEYWIGRESVGDLIAALRNPLQGEDASALSHRERDIVKAIVKGASNKDIAWQLGLGEQTVKNHLRRIFAKLKVANRVELAVHAMEHLLEDQGSGSGSGIRGIRDRGSGDRAIRDQGSGIRDRGSGDRGPDALVNVSRAWCRRCGRPACGSWRRPSTRRRRRRSAGRPGRGSAGRAGAARRAPAARPSTA